MYNTRIMKLVTKVSSFEAANFLRAFVNGDGKTEGDILMHPHIGFYIAIEYLYRSVLELLIEGKTFDEAIRQARRSLTTNSST